jgi:hypothetical protein
MLSQIEIADERIRALASRCEAHDVMSKFGNMDTRAHVNAGLQSPMDAVYERAFAVWMDGTLDDSDADGNSEWSDAAIFVALSASIVLDKWTRIVMLVGHVSASVMIRTWIDVAQSGRASDRVISTLASTAQKILASSVFSFPRYMYTVTTEDMDALYAFRSLLAERRVGSVNAVESVAMFPRGVAQVCVRFQNDGLIGMVNYLLEGGRRRIYGQSVP